MKKEELSRMFQLSGFVYYAPGTRNFPILYPTDLIFGAIINENSKEHGVEDLIHPYSMDKLLSVLKSYGRDRVLNSKVFEVKPCVTKALVCDEFVATVGSMSVDGKIHDPVIKHVSDPQSIEFRCSCRKKLRNRDVKGVWEPLILNEWKPVLSEGKHYYLEAICPHVSSLKFNASENFGVKVLGFNDGLDFMKPYVLAYIDILKCAPKFRNYAIDIVLTYHSSMFNKVKKNVNKMRESMGLGSLVMYDLRSVSAYIEYELVKGGYERGKLNEVIEIAESI